MNSITALSEKQFINFWKKIDRRSKDECWNWKAATESGYGRFGINGKLFLAHRISWMLSFGDIPEGLDVCHSCDNRLCCNPHHLFPGTQQDNMTDMVLKGRSMRGTGVWQAKLTEDKVIEIRNLISDGFSTRKIGKMFGVTSSTVSKIGKRQLWSWLRR